MRHLVKAKCAAHVRVAHKWFKKCALRSAKSQGKSARDLPFGLPEKTSLDYQKVFKSVIPLGQTDGLEKKRKNNGGSRAL